MGEKPDTSGGRKFIKSFLMRRVLLLTSSLLFIVLFKPQLVSADIWGKLLNGLWVAFNFLFNAILLGINGLTVMGIVGTLRALVWSLQQDPIIYPLAGGLGNMMRQFILLLYPFWVIALLLTAIYLIFVAVDPPRRYRAKSMLQKLLVGMVVTATSPVIYQITLNLSHGITEGIIGPGGVLDNIVSSLPVPYNSVDTMFFMILPIDTSSWTLRTGVNMLVVFIPLLILLLFTILALAVVWFRYMTVILCAIFFPFTLFLYVFEATRGMGRELLKLTIVWIFTPMIMSVWLVALVALIPSIALGMNVLTGVMLLMSFSVMMVVSPLVLSGLLAIIGAAVTAVGMMVPGKWGVALTAVGGLMQGQKASAMIGAAMKYGFQKKMQAAKRKFEVASLKQKIGGSAQKIKNSYDKAADHRQNAKQYRQQARAAQQAGDNRGAQKYKSMADRETRKANAAQHRAQDLSVKQGKMKEKLDKLKEPNTEGEKTERWAEDSKENEKERQAELAGAKTAKEKYGINSKYDSLQDKIDQKYSRGKHIPRVFDQKQGEKDLKTDAEAGYNARSAPGTAAQKKQRFDDANPVGATRKEADALAQQGIHSRADLARVSDSELQKLAADTGIGKDRLGKLRDNAYDNVNKEPTKAERKRIESGKSSKPTERETEDEKYLKDMLSVAGRRPKEKDDFLSAAEDQEQGP